MKSMHFLPPLIFSMSFLINCGTREGVNVGDNASKLSTIRVGEVDQLPNGEKAVYTKVEMKVSGAESTSYDKTFTFNKANGSALEETNAKLPYGSYRFLLKYTDAAGKIILESCAGGKAKDGSDITDEKSRIHRIQAARYEPSIQVCTQDNTPVVTPPPPPPKQPDEADVVIKPTVPGTGSGSNAGSQSAIFDKNARFYVDPYSLAANDAANMRNANDPNTSLIEFIARQGAAVWLGSWSGDVGNSVRTIMDNAQKQDAYAVLVAYMIPYRDCGLHSAGGLEASKYLPWISAIANAIGDRKAIVILEPDAVPGIIQIEKGKECLSPELRTERQNLLKAAIGILKAKPNTKVFIDAGHSAWLSAEEIARLLKLVGIESADGFALNTSNYQTTEAQIAYGQKIRSMVGNKNFLIDTSRNGVDPKGSTEWCNPRNRALGKTPTFDTGIEGVAAFIWGKRPGESDGSDTPDSNCNGGPAAGQWWREIAIELARNAGVK